MGCRRRGSSCNKFVVQRRLRPYAGGGGRLLPEDGCWSLFDQVCG